MICDRRVFFLPGGADGALVEAALAGATLVEAALAGAALVGGGLV